MAAAATSTAKTNGHAAAAPVNTSKLSKGQLKKLKAKQKKEAEEAAASAEPETSAQQQSEKQPEEKEESVKAASPEDVKPVIGRSGRNQAGESNLYDDAMDEADVSNAYPTSPDACYHVLTSLFALLRSSHQRQLWTTMFLKSSKRSLRGLRTQKG